MALLMTCSRGVVGRWRQITIRDFEIVPSSSPRWSGSSIGSLQYLRGLQSIKIHDKALSAWNQGPAMLIYFPPQLRKLTLVLPMRLDAWLTILPVKDSKNEVLSSESVSSRLQHIGVESKRFCRVDLGSLFPELQHLELEGSPYIPTRNYDKIVPKGKKAKIDPKTQAERFGVAALTYLYHHLPTTLKKLMIPQLNVLAEDTSNAIAKQKPVKASRTPAASTANYYLSSCILECLNKLPPSLETLQFSVSFIEEYPGFIPSNLLIHLPKSLTCLPMTFKGADLSESPEKFLAPLCEMPSLSFLSLDCSGIRSLGGSSLFSSSLEFSSSLTSLKLESLTSAVFADDFFMSLPRSLEYLEVHVRGAAFGRTADSKSIGSQLPKSLKTLVMRLVGVIGASMTPIHGIQDLPSGLTELDWRERCMISNDQVAALPKTLDSLRLDFSPLTFSRTAPSNYRAFEHYRIGSAYTGAPYRSSFPDEDILERSLSNACALYLSRVLTKLVITQSSFGNSFFLDLPTSIKHLEAETDQALTGDIFINSAFEYLKIDAPYLSLDCLRSLPTTLTTIHLTEPSNSVHFDRENLLVTKESLEHHYTINDQHIGMLPASLTELRVIGARNITDDAQWPPHLTQLVLTASCFLSDKSLTRLPRCLRVLQVQRIVIAPHLCGPKAAIIDSMPPFLLAHALPWMTLKNRHVDFAALP